MKPVLFAAAAAAIVLSSPAFAVEAKKTAAAPQPPEKVWAAVGDFCGIAAWHPAVGKCELSEKDGKTLRTLTLKDGGATLLEELVSLDEAARSYTYRILESPLPVEAYVSTLAVTPAGEGSEITWSSTFTAKGASDDEAKGVIEGIYGAGLAGIVAKAGQ